MDNLTILTDVSNKVGIMGDHTMFSSDLLDNINLAVGTLIQLGAAKATALIDKDTKYEDIYLPNASVQNRMLVQSYIRLKVKTLFDTPATGAVNTNNISALNQLEWRVQLSVTNIDEPS